MGIIIVQIQHMQARTVTFNPHRQVWFRRLAHAIVPLIEGRVEDIRIILLGGLGTGSKKLFQLATVLGCHGNTLCQKRVLKNGLLSARFAVSKVHLRACSAAVILNSFNGRLFY